MKKHSQVHLVHLCAAASVFGVDVSACDLEPARVSTDWDERHSHGTANISCLECYTLAVASITGIPACPDTSNAPLTPLTLSMHTYLMPCEYLNLFAASLGLPVRARVVMLCVVLLAHVQL